MMLKYASLAVIEAKIAQPNTGLVKDAHRHEFEYEPQPGFLYVRSRAISSRCNDNFDEFPGDQIKTAWQSFIGKPVFVNHKNDNPGRARGVIVDAALHEDVNPDGSEDTWVEVLMEVDAVRFPMLAKAIMLGHIDRTSMGTNVAYSMCSFCGNKAETPLDYCKHIPAMKGQRIFRRNAANGEQEGVLVREICHGLSFFENSLLVEDPADPTAYFLGVDARGVEGAATIAASHVRTASGISEPAIADRSVPDLDGPYRGLPWQEQRTARTIGATDTAVREDSGISSTAVEAPTRPCATCRRPLVLKDGAWLDMEGKTASDHQHNPDGQHTAKTATRAVTAYGEVPAPAKVDTLREDTCPVCGEKDSYNGDECMVCNYAKPPSQFTDPDTDAAKAQDLRQEQQEGAGAPAVPGQEGQPADAAVPDLPSFVPPDDAAAEGDEPVDPNAPEVPAEDDAADKDAPDDAADKDGPPKPADGAAPDDKPEKDDDEDPSKPDFLKKKKDPKKASVQIAAGQHHGEGADVAMRPTLAALAEQQIVIEAQNKAIDRIASLAGIDLSDIKSEAQTRTAALRRTADVDNPAQPIPDPPAEAPVVTTQEALAPDATDDPTSVGASPLTDVAADATTDVLTPEVVLDEPLDLNEVDVTAPVAGTEEMRPLDEVKIETEQRMGEPTQDVAFSFADGGWGGGPQVTGSVQQSEGRTFGAMRLARLRIQAGIAEGDDLTIGAAIASDEAISDEALQSEIETLAKVVAARPADPAQQIDRTATRRLVPQGAARTVPSMAPTTASTGPEIGEDTSPSVLAATGALAVSPDESLFE